MFIFPVVPSIIFGKKIGEGDRKIYWKNSRFIDNLKDMTQGFPDILSYNAFILFNSRNRHFTNEMEDSAENLKINMLL